MTSDTPQEYCISFADVLAAAKRIDGTAHRTPVLTSASINEQAGCNLFFKVEALQKTGSFKFRGALNAIRSELEKAQPNPPSKMHAVTHSSGNHAQALALAAKLSSTDQTQVSATIVMPRNCPMVKRKAVAAFGGNIILVDNTNEARETEADRIVEETGAVFVHPSEDPRVIAGQGTTCLEFLEQIKEQFPSAPALDVVIIPVGGGGLAAGNITTVRAVMGNSVKIVLAEPAIMDDAKRSFDSKTLLGHDPNNPLDSVADGLKTTLGPNTWPIVRDMVDEIRTVSEADILRATKLIWERLKVCIEPSAGVGVAVALSEGFKQKYSDCQNVGVILCGGNVDVLKIAQKMEAMLEANQDDN